MAKQRYDILLDDNGNYQVANGDFVVGPSDDQHVLKLLTTAKGMIREFPSVGVDIVRKLHKTTTNIEELNREIRVNLEADGYKFNGLAFDANGEFKMDYERNY